MPTVWNHYSRPGLVGQEEGRSPDPKEGSSEESCGEGSCGEGSCGLYWRGLPRRDTRAGGERA